MKKVLLWMCLAVLVTLTGCAVESNAPTLTNYGTYQPNTQADSQGWFTFGDTRFKGKVVNGAPDGDGLCIVKTVAPNETPCSFVAGVRSDAAYVSGRNKVLKEMTSSEIATELRESRDREARHRLEVLENNRRVDENNRYMNSLILQSQTKMKTDMERLDAAGRGTTVEWERAKAERQSRFNAAMEEVNAESKSNTTQDRRTPEGIAHKAVSASGGATSTKPVNSSSNDSRMKSPIVLQTTSVESDVARGKRIEAENAKRDAESTKNQAALVAEAERKSKAAKALQEDKQRAACAGHYDYCRCARFDSARIKGAVCTQ